MGQLLARARAHNIRQLPGAVPVIVSVNGSLAQLKIIAPLTAIDVRFNSQYMLRWLRHSGQQIIFSYPNTQPHSLMLDNEKTFKEGHTLHITFRPRSGTSLPAQTESFDWYPDLTCIKINLITQ